MGELTIDKFGEIIDGFLKDNHVQILIDIPEGTTDAQVKDNVEMGSVIQFYIMLHGLKASFGNMLEEMKDMLDPGKTEDMVDGILEIVKRELMKDKECCR